MSEYRVQKGCHGITMEDGTKYNADKTGKITVDNPNHAYHIERNAKLTGGHIHKAGPVYVAKTASRYCKPCRFTGYAWHKSCPRCGGEMEMD